LCETIEKPFGNCNIVFTVLHHFRT
jgi:hypothetical protein